MIILVFIITEFIWSLKEKAFPKFLKTSLIMLIPLALAVGINFANLNTCLLYTSR